MLHKRKRSNEIIHMHCILSAVPENLHDLLATTRHGGGSQRPASWRHEGVWILALILAVRQKKLERRCLYIHRIPSDEPLPAER